MNYKDLIIWQEAMNIIELTYQSTSHFPKSELFCLTQQARRSAISIASNIAEGYTRQSTKEYIHFLYYAKGSLSELETQIYIAQRLEYLPSDVTRTNDYFDKINILSKRLNALIRTLKDKVSKP